MVVLWCFSVMTMAWAGGLRLTHGGVNIDKEGFGGDLEGVPAWGVNGLKVMVSVMGDSFLLSFWDNMTIGCIQVQ